MANKIFSIYSSGPDEEQKDDDRLILEIGKTHFACMVQCGSRNTVADFELFRLKEGSNNYEDFFNDLQSNSKLLNRSYSEKKVYIQNEMSVLVPENKFKEEIRNDYLDVAWGEDTNMVTMSDRLYANAGIINVYRVSTDIIHILNLRMNKVIVQHTYSQIIRSLFPLPANTPAQLIKVQFYNQHLIVTVISEKILLLIQTFQYQSPADVLYHLLNISQRLALDDKTLVMKISGMIDLKSALYSQLLKYFNNIVVEDADSSIFHLDASEYPLHYFTPIFNLAV